MPHKERIAVIGAGLMGHGIAQVFALNGHEVAIYDPVPASLANVKARIETNLRDLGDDLSALARVTPNGSLAGTVREANFIVEAAFEDLVLKQKLFGEIEAVAPPTRSWPATPRSSRSPRSCRACAIARARSEPIGGTHPISCRWSR